MPSAKCARASSRCAARWACSRKPAWRSTAAPTPLLSACQSRAIKHSCTTGKERRITRWEHEHILEAAQRRLDEHPEKMRQRREMVEHPFGTIKARMGATHFLMRTLRRVAAEMALHVLAYSRGDWNQMALHAR